MITQAEIETYRDRVQNAFDTLFVAYEKFRKVEFWVEYDPIFKDLMTALSDVGTFRAGNVHDYSELFVGFRVDDVYADDLEDTFEERDFVVRIENALESIESAQNFFTETVEESRYHVRCHENGDVIDTYPTLGEAQNFIEECEAEDKDNGEFVEGFYEIYDSLKDEIVACKEWYAEQVTTTKRVSASGGALKISITSECNAMGLGVGDYVEVTIRKVLGRR